MRVTTIEGTPEELAKLQDLTGMFLPVGAGANGQGTGKSTANPKLDGELRDFILNRAQGKVRFERASEFVADALARGDIEAQLGKKGKGSTDGLGNYLLLYKKGPRRYGAAAYLTPGSGRVDFRLPQEAVAGREHAQVLDVRPEDQYKVRTYLGSAEAIQEALELLDEAIKRIEQG